MKCFVLYYKKKINKLRTFIKKKKKKKKKNKKNKKKKIKKNEKLQEIHFIC